MATTSLPPAVRADRALVRQIAVFDESVESAEDFADLMKNSAANAPLQKEAAALRKRMDAAVTGKDRREVGKSVAALAKDADKLADKASQAHGQDLYERYMVRWTKARGLLAQALVEIGDVEPLALRQPVQKEQADLRAQLDRVEKENVRDPGNLDTLERLIPTIEAFLKRLGGARAAAAWVRSNYTPLIARVQSTLKQVSSDRCRKTLLAELDFIEVDTHKALARGDVKTVQARSLPQLQRIERLAAGIAAASPAIDRELARLARRVAAGPDANLTRRLKAMIQAKATNWPDGADADGIDTALARFEADLARLGAEIDQVATAKATAKA